MTDYEAEKSIRVAEAAMREGNYEKAKKFLQKSLKIQETNKARDLLAQCERLHMGGDQSKKAPEEAKANRKKSKEESKEDNSPTFSQNDVRLCEEILKKTNYYDILGAEKGEAEDEIKRKYKKLALRLHPDKNHAPQATEAFKKVTQAFSCLTDKNKRKIYDEHGTENNFRQQYHEYFQDEEGFDADDIFEMFFSGRVNPNRRRRAAARSGHTYYYTTGGANTQEQNPRGRFGALMQMLPLLLILLVALLFQMKGSMFAGNSALYSFEQTNTYRIPKSTENAGVVYYVSQSYAKLKESEIAELEREIEQEHVSNLGSQCNYVKRLKNYLEDQYRSGWNDENSKRRIAGQIRGLNFAPCKEYERIRNLLS